MENDIFDNTDSIFQLHLFDCNTDTKKKKKKRWFTLAKPKTVVRGGKGVCQYYKINETKLTLEQRFGEKVESFDI